MAENKVRILELDDASMAEVKEQGFIPVSVEGKTYKLALLGFGGGKTSELENDAKFVSQSDIGTEYGTDKAGEPVDSYDKFSVVWHNDKMYVATSAVVVERDVKGEAIWDASKWQETTQQELDFGFGHAIRQLSDEMPTKTSQLENDSGFVSNFNVSVWEDISSHIQFYNGISESYCKLYINRTLKLIWFSISLNFASNMSYATWTKFGAIPYLNGLNVDSSNVKAVCNNNVSYIRQIAISNTIDASGDVFLFLKNDSTVSTGWYTSLAPILFPYTEKK